MQATLGHYRVVEQIGSGGMGVVYRARDQRLERDVAIKVLAKDRLSDEESRRRFRREALALSKLNHPNIATIHDFNTIDGVDVLVMEHIPGRNLDALVEDGPLSEREVARLGQQLLAALEAAHQHGVIHRDLKPGNVRITPDGLLKVLDFGLARALQLDAEATTDSVTGEAFAGTLPYMAPEQLRGDRIDARTDVYAVGAVLYELATGTRVHAGLSGARLMGAILDDAPVSPRALNPRVSQDLEQALCKALDKDPQLRYQSARELRVDLERLLAPARSATAIPAAAARPPFWSRRRALVGAFVVATLAVTGWLAYREWPRAAPGQPRGWILVADFENGTGDEELAGVIRDGLTIQLQQSRYLHVLSREQVFDALRRMERVGAASLDAATALELAQREAIPLLLTGTAYKRGDATWIAVQGTDTVRHAALFTETTQFRSENELFDRLDSLASRVREHLGESLSGIAQDNQPLAKVTTRSLDALKLYSRASEKLVAGDADAALPQLQAALDVDPKFAMAHMLIARVYETLGNPDRERQHLARAYEFKESLTHRERRRVEGSYHIGRGEYEKAVTSLTALVNLYPSDVEARYELALAHRNEGEWSKAIDELEATIAADPYVTVAYGDLMLFLARVGHHQRARAVYEQALQRNASGPKLDWAYGMVLLGEGRPDSARDQFRKLERSEVYAGIARLYLASSDLLEGRVRAATELLQAGVLLDRRSNNVLAEFMRGNLLVRTLALAGRRADARMHLDTMLKAGGQLAPNELRIGGTLLAEFGDLPQARSILRMLDRIRREAPSRFADSCYENLTGEIALAEGRVDDAVIAFTAAAAHYRRALTSRALARTHMARRDWPRARGAWREALAFSGDILQEGFAADVATAHLELARASRHAGDVSEARAEYDRFLAMWRKGDDLPLVREAVAERRALDASAQ